MNILVVDDEPDVKLLFEQRFRREIREGSVQFYFAFSGAEALEILHGQEGADLILILSDINMPGMSGLELLRRIKEHQPQLCVFMITAYNDPDSHAQAMACGADDFLSKPLDFHEVREKLLQCQQAKQQEREKSQ